MSASKLYTATFREGDEERAKSEVEFLTRMGCAALGPEFVEFSEPSRITGRGYWLVVWNPYERVA